MPAGTALRSTLVAAALVAGTIAVCLLAGEGLCRLAGYRGLEQYRPDRALGWIPTPGQTTATRVGALPVQIDADGFRAAPLEQPKASGTIRIFALGASTTFGWGVRQDDTYEQVLERMLNDTARAQGTGVRYEVVNAGVIGFNLRQAARDMARIARRYEPDGFLVAYTFNDAWNRFGTPGAPSLGRVLAGVRAKNLLRRSALYNWLVDLLARRRYEAAAARGPGFAALTQTGDGPVSARDLATFHATLDTLLALGRTAHASLGFIVPAARDQGAPWPRQREMVSFAADARLPLLDLVSTHPQGYGDSLYLPLDAVHPTAQGHGLIARLLYAELCRAAAEAESGADAIYRAGCRAPPREPGPKKLRARPRIGDAPGK